ncbi:MAG: hypothetical protein JWO12_3652 [Frankiales bacterium]|nr:hypothetical protein [Frankiales bacterium]
MSAVAQFSRYIGLVVLLASLVLLAPRMTVTTWAGVTRSLRSTWHRARFWRPGTQVAERSDAPVQVTVGERRASDPDEVLDAEVTPHPWHLVLELWTMAREGLESGAVALALTGLVLRTSSALAASVPEPVVFGSDMLLVLGCFLVMQRVIRDYPAHLLPSALAPYLRPSAERMAKQPQKVVKSRARHLLEMALLAPGFVVLIGWPAEIGRFLAEKQFTGPQNQVLVVWACELPWFLALAWFLARPLIPRKAAARRVAPKTARVVPMPARATAVEERQAA